jgi:hypothetical protein
MTLAGTSGLSMDRVERPTGGPRRDIRPDAEPGGTGDGKPTLMPQPGACVRTDLRLAGAVCACPVQQRWNEHASGVMSLIPESFEVFLDVGSVTA